MAPSKRRAWQPRAGSHAERLVDLVVARPGVTIVEAAEQLGVSRQHGYTLLKTLRDNGFVRVKKGGLHPGPGVQAARPTPAAAPAAPAVPEPPAVPEQETPVESTEEQRTAGITSLIRDQLSAVEQKLSEYQELLDERDRLQNALDTMEGRRANVQAGPARSRVPRSLTGSGRAQRGANRAAVLEFVADNPGCSARDVVAATGIKRAVAYNLLARLVEQGEFDRSSGADGHARYTRS